jgi:hypothetical protein
MNFKIDHMNPNIYFQMIQKKIHHRHDEIQNLLRERSMVQRPPHGQISQFGFPLSYCYMYIDYFVFCLTGDFKNRSLEIFERTVIVFIVMFVFSEEIAFMMFIPPTSDFFNHFPGRQLSGTGAPIRGREHTPRWFLIPETSPLSFASLSSGLCRQIRQGDPDACGPADRPLFNCGPASAFPCESGAESSDGHRLPLLFSGASSPPCVPYPHFRKSQLLQAHCQCQIKID